MLVVVDDGVQSLFLAESSGVSWIYNILDLLASKHHLITM